MKVSFKSFIPLFMVFYTVKRLKGNKSMISLVTDFQLAKWLFPAEMGLNVSF